MVGELGLGDLVPQAGWSFTCPSIGVVVQSLLEPGGGRCNVHAYPLTGADERVIEASWGLGEVVGVVLVIPDHFRVDRTGALLRAHGGPQAGRHPRPPDGGTVEESVTGEQVSRLCLDDDQLLQLNALGGALRDVYGPDRDIEWAFAGKQSPDLYLLQCRAVTTVAGAPPRTPPGRQTTTTERAISLKPVPLFAELDDDDRAAVAHLFKERRFSAGETVVRERYSRARRSSLSKPERRRYLLVAKDATLGPGDYFGEIALIDEGSRLATVTAASDLVCQGITLWDFRPLCRAQRCARLEAPAGNGEKAPRTQQFERRT